MTTIRATDNEFRAIECGHVPSTERRGVELSPDEQKLMARFDQRQLRRSAGQKRFCHQLMTTPLIFW
jgi:hypothetical protein